MPKEKESKAEAPNAKVDQSYVIVKDKNGNVARRYTLALHGEKMVDYAKEYSKKIGGSYEFPIVV